MRIPCLDGLRAVAIILVLLSHLQHSGVPLWAKSAIASWGPGNVGVRLFFLISGFVITHILNLELEKNGTIDFKKFFFRRLLRIFPAFYSYLLALVLLSFFGVVRIDFYAVLFAAMYVQNFNVVHLEGWWLVSHAWSLSVEEQFYLIFPFLLRKLKIILQIGSARLMVMLSLICTLFRILAAVSPRISLLTGGVFFMYCDYFFYGAALAIFLQRIRDQLQRSFYIFRYWLLLLALIALIYSSKVEFDSFLHILFFGNLFLFSSLYILLFFLLFPSSTLGRVLEQKWMRTIGTLSYSLYVWQQLFLGAATDWIDFKFATAFPYNLVLVIICASCSYVFIERPFLKIKANYRAY